MITYTDKLRLKRSLNYKTVTAGASDGVKALEPVFSELKEGKGEIEYNQKTFSVIKGGAQVSSNIKLYTNTSLSANDRVCQNNIWYSIESLLERPSEHSSLYVYLVCEV